MAGDGATAPFRARLRAAKRALIGPCARRPGATRSDTAHPIALLPANWRGDPGAQRLATGLTDNAVMLGHALPCGVRSFPASGWSASRLPHGRIRSRGPNR
jgi:hypothetical protein